MYIPSSKFCKLHLGSESQVVLFPFFLPHASPSVIRVLRSDYVLCNPISLQKDCTILVTVTKCII